MWENISVKELFLDQSTIHLTTNTTREPQQFSSSISYDKI